MYDMSEKLSTYIENAYEKIIQPNALKNAPGITFLIVVCFIFDILNINIKNIDSTRNETKYLSITVNIDISSSTGISDAAIWKSLFPKTKSTIVIKSDTRKTTVYAIEIKRDIK